jgi:hypothetical protein
MYTMKGWQILLHSIQDYKWISFSIYFYVIALIAKTLYKYQSHTHTDHCLSMFRSLP